MISGDFLEACRQYAADRLACDVRALSWEQLQLPLDGDPSPTAGVGPLLVTVPDAGRMLGIGRTSTYELLRSGELELVHVHRSARVPVASIHAYVDRLRQTAS